MAKKGKAKISKVKRNNQTTNKMKKQGKLKLQRHRAKVQKQKQPAEKQVEYSSESESASGDEWADMLDEEEQQYILNRLAKQPQLLSNVPEKDQQTKARKRKREQKLRPPRAVNRGSDSGAESYSLSDSGSEIEENYEKEMAERPRKKIKPLLPIKTKDGLMERSEECEDTESEEEEVKPKEEKTVPEHSDSDSGMEGTGDDDVAESGVTQIEVVGGGETEDEVVSAVELLTARRDKLKHDKLRIGALCSSLLENPERKLKNLYPILYLMEERVKDGSLNLQSVRKLATLSACEVFKDILPDYQIRHQDYSNVKLKKETLMLYKHEKELLEFYKRYLQRLEKVCAVLRPKKGDTRKQDESSTALALVSLRCMCGLLAARPNFNYATNIAQSVIPHLDSRLEESRAIVTECCSTVFAEDNKGEITLSIVRLINQLVKRRGSRLHPSALDSLLTLKIRDIDMDEQADIQHKKKQEEKHKKRIVNLSKKEKKRAKKLKEVERELLETEAQENSSARKKQLTEVTKTVFHIYFRLLKTAPGSRLLAAALKGLAKFTHVINLEYYTDLVAILSGLLANQEVSRRDRLLCVRTVLAILASAGDALTVDPERFHRHLYANMLAAHAGSSQEDAKIILESVEEICSRARRVSVGVLQAFGKRLATFSLQLQHHAALASLVLLYQLIQQSKSVRSLLECDSECSGRFAPLVESPEHAQAAAAVLYELGVLRRHYHPALRDLATHLHSTLPSYLNKMSPVRVYESYDGSQMAFKPAIPPPKSTEQGAKRPAHKHVWAQKSLQQLCEQVETNIDMAIK